MTTKAINKNFLKTIKSVINRPFEHQRPSNQEGYVKEWIKCIQEDIYNSVENYCEFYEDIIKNDDLPNEDKLIAYTHLAKLAGIFTPLLIDDNQTNPNSDLLIATKVYSVIKPDIYSPNNDIYRIIAYYAEREGYDEYDFNYGNKLDDVPTIEALNYITFAKYQPAVNSTLSRVCKLNTKTKRFVINGFYKQYTITSKEYDIEEILRRLNNFKYYLNFAERYKPSHYEIMENFCDDDRNKNGKYCRKYKKIFNDYSCRCL